MFRALLCSSSGSKNCIIQYLVSSHSVGGRPVHRLGEEAKSFGYTSLARAVCRWVDNIKTDLQDGEWRGMDCTDLMEGACECVEFLD